MFESEPSPVGSEGEICEEGKKFNSENEKE